MRSAQSGLRPPPTPFAAFRRALLAGALARKYRPDQPRVPGGNPDGGQWTDDDGGGGSNATVRESYRTLLAQNITGFTKHGINRAINREVRPAAILDAMTNPIDIIARRDGSVQYRGARATVVVNPGGKVISVWSKE